MRSGTTLLASLVESIPGVQVVSDELTWFWTHLYSKNTIGSFDDLFFVLGQSKPLISKLLKRTGRDFTDLIYFVNNKKEDYQNNIYGVISCLFDYTKGQDFRPDISCIFIKSTQNANAYQRISFEIPDMYLIHCERSKEEVVYSQFKKTRNLYSYRPTSNGIVFFLKNIRNRWALNRLQNTSTNCAIVDSLIGRIYWLDMNSFIAAYDYDARCFDWLKKNNIHFRYFTVNYNEYLRNETIFFNTIDSLVIFLGMPNLADDVKNRLLQSSGGNSSFGTLGEGLNFNIERSVPSWVIDVCNK